MSVSPAPARFRNRCIILSSRKTTRQKYLQELVLTLLCVAQDLKTLVRVHVEQDAQIWTQRRSKSPLSADFPLGFSEGGALCCAGHSRDRGKGTGLAPQEEPFSLCCCEAVRGSRPRLRATTTRSETESRCFLPWCCLAERALGPLRPVPSGVGGGAHGPEGRRQGAGREQRPREPHM